MDNIKTSYKTEVIDCPTCNGKGTTTTYSSGSSTSTANNVEVIKCRTCNGNGKLEKITVVTEIYKNIKLNE